MKRQEAEDLAARMSRTWKGGPPADVWLEELEQLDAGPAGTAYARLRRESTRAPSVAEFIKTYRSVVTVDGGTAVGETCEVCDGQGWVEAEPLYRNADRLGEQPYFQVRPCDCAEGDRRRQSSVWRERER
jgi:hypothetical protein